MSYVKYSSLNRCHTCLGDPVEITSLEILKKSADILSALTYCNVEIVKGLPNSICTKCVRTFENIVSFKNQCKVSKTFLQNLYEEYLKRNENGKLNAEKVAFDIKTENDNFRVKSEELDLDIKRELDKEDDSFHQNDYDSLPLFEDRTETGSETNNRISITKAKSELDLDIKRESDKEDDSFHQNDYDSLPSFEERTEIESQTHNRESKIKESPGSITCKKCRFKCNTSTELENHYQNKHATICNICNKKFWNTHNLRRHREVHEKDRPKHFCNICKKFYDGKPSYDYHFKRFHSHANRRKTVCNLCGVSVYIMKAHMRSKHANSDDKFICIHCSKGFKLQSSLRSHTLIYHENPEKYMSLCPECGQVFRTAGNMRTHLKQKHSNERNYQCRYCEKTFKASYPRSRHEKSVHFNERKYECEICLKSFTAKPVLKNHIRIHTGEKPFVCKLCSRAFVQKAALRTHVKSVHGLENTEKIATLEKIQ